MSQSEFSELLAFQPRHHVDDDEFSEASEQSDNLFDGDDTQRRPAVSELFLSVRSLKMSEPFPSARTRPDACQVYDGAST